MKAQDLSKAKNPELRASLAAMERAAAMARKIAIQTDTAIVVVQDGKLIRISAEQLRQEEQNGGNP
jgi:sensor histidine kinase regulating citrate/malate metabolism